MKSPNDQKYCVGCEAWHFDQEPFKKEKFGELVPLANTDVLLKDSKLAKKYRGKQFDYVLNQSVIRSLQSKLYYLCTLLNSESDVTKINEILTTINMCLENIRMASCFEKNKFK